MLFSKMLAGNFWYFPQAVHALAWLWAVASTLALVGGLCLAELMGSMQQSHTWPAG